MKTCCGEVIKNTAMGKDFYYCRGCKKEVLDKVIEIKGDPSDWSGVFYDLVTKDATHLVWKYFLSGAPIGSGTMSFSVPHKSVKKLQLEDWLTRDISYPFCGVDRTIDPDHLAGINQDLSSYGLASSIGTAPTIMAISGAYPDLYICDALSYNNYTAQKPNSWGAQVVSNNGLNFKGASILTAHGARALLPCDTVPPQTLYALTMDTWELKVNFNLVCGDPGKNGRFKLPK